MPEKQPEKSKSPLDGLKQDVNDYIRRRADNPKDIPNLAEEVMPIRGGRKQSEILLLVSELENLLFTIPATDFKVYTAREKLAELKNLLGKNLGIR